MFVVGGVVEPRMDTENTDIGRQSDGCGLGCEALRNADERGRSGRVFVVGGVVEPRMDTDKHGCWSTFRIGDGVDFFNPVFGVVFVED